MKSRVSIRYITLIAALCLLSVAMSGCLNINQSGYEFKSGITPPAVVSNLMQNRTVVLFITHNNCPDCEQARPLIANLQSQYSGMNVTFVNVNISANRTSQDVAKAYGVTATTTPTTIVLRKDGSAATFVGVFDPNIVKSAIDDARSSY
ncbi:MAG: thioredoxin family protein [Halobacteriota archaeon]